MKTRIYYCPLPTPAGLCALSLVTLIPAIGLLGDVPLNYLLIMLLGALGFAALNTAIDAWRMHTLLCALEIECDVPPTLHAAVLNTLTIKIAAREAVSSFLLEIRPEVPPGSKAEQQVYILSIAQGSSCTELKHCILPLKRGKMQWSTLYGRILLPPGLMRWQFEVPLAPPRLTEVYANASPAEQHQVHPFRKLDPGELLMELSGGEGREFDSLRRYAAGDDLRKVDWKRSAQGRGVLVKVYRPETHQRLHIALDCSRRMSNRIGERQELDHAADAAAHLINLAAHNGDEVGLFAFNHQVAAEISCRRGKRQEQRIAQELMTLQPGKLEADYDLLASWARLNKRRSLLLLITSIANPSSLDVICQALLPARRKHLPLVFAIASRDLRNLTQAKAANLDQAYSIAAAMEQLSQIQARVKTLEKSGIACIYCDAQALPEMMRAKYYQLKLLGKL